MAKKRSDQFEEEKELIKLKAEMEEKIHLMRMKEIEYRRVSEKIHHEHELERQRIKSAEIRKNSELNHLRRQQIKYNG